MSAEPAGSDIFVTTGSGYVDVLYFVADDDPDEPIVLTDWTGWSFRVRRKKGKRIADAPLVIDITEGSGLTVDGPAGTVAILITDEEMAGLDGVYFWELWADEDDGAGSQIQGGGRFVVGERVEP